MDKSKVITIRGAREHNLKNINVELPKNKLIVFTGISGSGKSSLAFDTIYAEGQRRYVESLSSYARQFLGLMAKPDVDAIEGLSPAISIDQKSVSHNPRSTVGTVTEIYDYLRLLFARIGHPHCPSCGTEIAQQSAQQLVDSILSFIKKEFKNRALPQLRLMILSPVVRDRKGEFGQLLKNLKARGYRFVRIDRQIFDLKDEIALLKTNKHSIEVVIDRLTVERSKLNDAVSFSTFRSRIGEDVEQSLTVSDGLVLVAKVRDKGFVFPERPREFEDHLYSEKFACPSCNKSIPEIEPRTFSFNSPHGACPSCTGIGTRVRVDEELVLNPRLSILEGGILPFAAQFFHDTWFARTIKAVCQKIGVDLYKPLANLSKKQKEILLHGTADEIHEICGTNRQGRTTTIYETFAGVVGELEKRYNQTQSDFIRVEIEKFMREEVCPLCEGARLKKESLSITILNLSIAKLCSFFITQLAAFFKSLPEKLSQRERTIAQPILKEIEARLSFLASVGLDYLTLDRHAASLAGGEAQRIRLASQIGSGLSGVLYVLDEPSIGLHQRDNQRLIDTLKRLRDLGNTVIVAEHDREVMNQADLIVDFGPGAGEEGGRIVALGSPAQIKNPPNSLTGKYLSGKKRIKIRGKNFTNQYAKNGLLTIRGCRQFNLKNIDVSFPLGQFICVTGVSGSGKSTLVVETLYHALAQRLNPYHRQKPGIYQKLEGANLIDKVILIDQSPIGKTPRSNPATYTGVFDYIRQLFSQVTDARVRGYKPGRFSFNVKGGRCESCQGEGQVKIEMQFLADVYITCEVCGGNRYNRETLEVHFKGKSIANILSLSVKEALSFFSAHPAIFHKLSTLNNVGLSYLKLGQPAPTLSGGEAQRVKLATHLGKKATGNTIYLLDEPTTGLHFADLEKLITVLKALVDQGNTVIIIEHNLDVIKNADWIVDLGPEGGEKGGMVVAEGPPAIVARNSLSYTAKFLGDILD